jgi:cardiolipin synthase
VATVDGKWSTIGSYNLNHISDYASIEINVGILNEKFTQQFDEVLTEIIRNDCRQVTLEEFNRRRTWFTKANGWLSYQTLRLLMRIMYQLTSKKKRQHTIKQIQQ